MKSSMKTIYKIVICILGVIVLLFLYFLYHSKYDLTFSYYRVQSEKIEKEFRVVQISDLHNSEFGDENCRLVQAVKSQEPDLIFLTGDLVNSEERETKVAVKLILQLRQIAPVYLSNGNHEWDYEERYGTKLSDIFEDAGATVLEKEYRDIEVSGQTIRIGGIYGYCMPARYLETGEADEEECAFLEEFQTTDLYTVLLCHMPFCWTNINGLNEWNVDCVFAGHLHGGEVVLPFIGGLYAPELGWFPGKIENEYYSDNKEKILILSRGLGTSAAIPRLNNVPEIVVADFLPEES